MLWRQKSLTVRHSLHTLHAVFQKLIGPSFDLAGHAKICWATVRQIVPSCEVASSASWWLQKSPTAELFFSSTMYFLKVRVKKCGVVYSNSADLKFVALWNQSLVSEPNRTDSS